MEEKQFKHKGLKELFFSGGSSKISSELNDRIIAILDVLATVETLEDFTNLPALRFHELKGKRKDEFSLSVNKNWRITFMWDEGPYNINLEDYH